MNSPSRAAAPRPTLSRHLDRGRCRRRPRPRVTLLAGAVLLVATGAALGACKGDSPAEPSNTQGTRTGSLTLTVSGLPAGTPGEVVVQGPSSFSRTVTGSTTLSELEPGTYSVNAHEITAASTIYAPTPATQSRIVAGGSSTPATAGVRYAATTGSLAIAISGLPSGASANVTVTGPNSYSQAVTASQTLTTLRTGTYTIAAATVTVGGTVYAPTVASPDVSVSAGATAVGAVSYAPQQQTGADLTIAGLYLVQSVQRLDRSVPLVSGRDAVLRVFVRADKPLTATPTVRVKLFRSGQLARTMIVSAPTSAVPTGTADASEGSVASSWNVVVPGSLIAPGLSISADVDPYDGYGESDETDNAYPASGTASITVQAAPIYRVRFIPIAQGGQPPGNVTEANAEQFLDATRKMHPVKDVDSDVGETYTVSYKLSSDNADNTWSRLLSEIEAKRVAEGTGRNYYGVMQVTYNSGIAGLGYMPGHSAIGWEYLTNGRASEVMAHEVGHNFSLQHTPCGGPADPDPAYPYAGGVTGVYGYDVSLGANSPAALKPPTLNDLMGYCSGKWISDYDYKKVLTFRNATAAATGSTSGGALGAADADVTATTAAATEPCLLVWGRVVDGVPVLEPAFVVTTRPSRPRRGGGGPLTLRATSASGATLWSRSFSGSLVADTPTDDRAFSFAIPLREIGAEAVASLRLEARGRVVAAHVEGTAAAGAADDADVRLTRATTPSGGALRLRWNAARHPVLMVRDAHTGAVLSFARGGDATVLPAAATGDAVDVALPNRVQNAWRRVHATR